MASKPSRPKKTKARPALPPPTGSERERIVRAFMQLLAEKPIERMDLNEIAKRASVSLAKLRGEFDSTPPRDRLFDVLMRRLEALAPHKTAIRSLVRSAMCNPGLALALNGLGVRSMRWMLTAAGINTAGGKGALRAQGLAVMFAQVLRVWVNDDDPGLARTMAELDRALTSGQSWSRLLDDLCAVIPTLRRRRRPRRDEADEAAAA
jgi:AcrR family transcriptional regulator